VISHDVILTFSGGLAAALVLGFFAQRIGLTPIIGYLLAGIAVGPYTPGFVASREVAEQFAEIGIMLLMFGVGLRFHLHELLAVWRVAVPGAIVQSAASTVMAGVALHLMGLSWTSAMVVGMAISVASTVVLVRVLTENRDLHTQTGHIAVGWVVVEDLLTIGLLVMLPVLAGLGAAAPADGGASPLAAMGIALAKVVACVALVMVLGGKVIPWFLERIAGTRSSELFTLAVLAIALGVAVGSALAFGVSMALGAFLAGLVVSRTEFAARAAGDALPMRDAFAVLFFVSVGMLFDPGHLLAEPFKILAVLMIVVVGKPLAAIAVVLVARRPWAVALPVGMSLGQIGEFTFILGTGAKALGLIDDSAWHTLVAVAMITIAVNPALYRWSRRLAAPSPSAPAPLPEGGPVGDRRCVVIGYGPVGQHVVKALRSRQIPVAVIEMNLATVRQLRRDGTSAVYGDAKRWETLAEAGLDQAASLIISSDMPEPGEVVRLARARRPDLRVMVRCSHLREVEELRRLGAEVVVAGEGEVAITLTEAVLHAEGADPETVAQIRSGIRSTLGEAARS
jgi:CPA2 family monovalent cation:H+ antiporter-2